MKNKHHPTTIITSRGSNFQTPSSQELPKSLSVGYRLYRCCAMAIDLKLSSICKVDLLGPQTAPGQSPRVSFGIIFSSGVTSTGCPHL